MAYKDENIEMTNEFREFIKELSRRLADDSDYEK